MHLTHWLRRATIGLLATAVTVILLISSGLFDPRPIGSEQWSQTLFRQTIPVRSRQLTWLDALPKNPYTIRLTAAFRSGEPDSSYGLLLGRDENYILIAVSPLGYTTIQQQSPSASGLQPANFFPFQPWPHVHPGSEANEIWADVENGRLTVRLNREWLWAGEVGKIEGQMGMYGESFGETAVIDFQKIQLFTNDS